LKRSCLSLGKVFGWVTVGSDGKTKRGAMPEGLLAGKKFHRLLSREIFSNAKINVEQPYTGYLQDFGRMGSNRSLFWNSFVQDPQFFGNHKALCNICHTIF
jgi:hypothetical protein